MSDTKFSYEENAATMAKNYKCSARIWFILGVVSAVLVVAAGCWAYFTLAYHFSVWASLPIILAEVSFIVVSAWFFRESGYCSAVKFHESELLKAEARIDRRIDDYLRLVNFVKVKSPKLFAEFTAWQEERPQSPVDGVKDK